MRRLWAGALALALFLTGCRQAGALPYGREIEDMELVRVLGVDLGTEDGVAVTAAGAGEEEPSAAAARSISAAVLSLQGEGSSYLYFGHVSQLLAGEELARRGLGEALDYVLRDVEMRLETALYLVRGGTAAQAITSSAAQGPAADRLEALAADAGLTAGSMPRTVKEVLADLERQGASFAPAVLADGALTAAGYGIIKEGVLAGWAEGEAARGVNLILGRVDADVVTVNGPDGAAVLRVVGATPTVRAVWSGGRLTGLEVSCRVDANLAEGSPMPDRVALEALAGELARVEGERMTAALELAQTLDADYLGLRPAAALAAPWQKGELLGETGLAGLELRATVRAEIQRSYHADG